MERLKWVDRKFSLDIPPGWMPNVLERLRGTTPRLLAVTEEFTDAESSGRIDGKWSIRDHIGHLGDLEELHDGRIDDFIARRKMLRAADMRNQKTEAARHNLKDAGQLIDRFDRLRRSFIARLEGLDDETMEFVSLHPRLKKPMRPVDMAFFTAEHDDHHLASIRHLINSQKR